MQEEYYNEQEGGSDDPEEELDDTQNSSEEDNNDEENKSSDDTSPEGEDEDKSPSKEDETNISKKLKELEGKLNYYKTQYKKLKKGKKQEPQSDGLTREEVILIAKGYGEDELNELNAIAKGKGISLKEAEKDPLFVAYKAQKEEETKKKEAKLGAGSGGAGGASAVPIEEDKHKEYWEKRKRELGA